VDEHLAGEKARAEAKAKAAAEAEGQGDPQNPTHINMVEALDQIFVTLKHQVVGFFPCLASAGVRPDFDFVHPAGVRHAVRLRHGH
jgi:hypothetical protein